MQHAALPPMPWAPAPLSHASHCVLAPSTLRHMTTAPPCRFPWSVWCLVLHTTMPARYSMPCQPIIALPPTRQPASTADRYPMLHLESGERRVVGEVEVGSRRAAAAPASATSARTAPATSTSATCQQKHSTAKMSLTSPRVVLSGGLCSSSGSQPVQS